MGLKRQNKGRTKKKKNTYTTLIMYTNTHGQIAATAQCQSHQTAVELLWTLN